MESLPAFLRWLLEQQPPGFVDVIAEPLWQLVTSLQYLLHSTTPTTANLLSSIFSVGREYQIALSSDAAASRYPAAKVEKALVRVAISHAVALPQAHELYRDKGTPVTSPHLQQLIYNPAFVQANLLTVAGWCKLKQEERQHGQQGRAATGTSTRGSSSKQGSKSSHQHGSNRSSSSSSRSNNSSSGSSSSSSCTSAAVQATAAGAPGSFAQLEIPPDHDLAAAAFGRTALAAQVVFTKLQFLAAARRGITSTTRPGVFLEPAFYGLLEGTSSAVHTKRSFLSSAGDLQLLLELLALAGAEVEEGRDGMKVLLNILLILNSGMHTISRADRGAFLAARASMMLQVLNLMLALIRRPKGTQPFGSPQSEARMEGSCLEQMAMVFLSVSRLGGEGGWFGDMVTMHVDVSCNSIYRQL